MKVIVMMGLPGSGKSTWSKSVSGRKLILSSDNYFTDSDGNYNWTIKEAHKGHEDCLRRFMKVFWPKPPSGDPIPGPEVVIIDNTNVRIHDISPYIRIAQAYGCQVEVKYIKTNIEVAKSRNIHRVPEIAYDIMQRNLDNLLKIWPKDFPQIELVETTAEPPTCGLIDDSIDNNPFCELVITGFKIGTDIIQVIKWIVLNTKFSLTESRDAVFNLPATIIIDVGKYDAEKYKRELESIGAIVKIC
jgi:predicted kinase